MLEGKMKTGRDANQPGQYSSECCLVEIRVMKGQMLPRCPRCNALTVWDLMKRNRDSRGDAKQLLSVRR
jgi:hypothetical protein